MRAIFSILSLFCLSVMLCFCLHCFYCYYYPMKYQQDIENYAKEFDVEGALIASVSNAESSFNENAVSFKGAVGLMQLMPSTAQWLAEKLKISFDEEKLLEPQYNLRLGSYYLSYLINYFGNEKVAICAYNAGPNCVKNWLNDKTYSEDGKTLTKIPYTETQNYLNRVYKNYYYYSRKYK